jgi:hypothetical protein
MSRFVPDHQRGKLLGYSTTWMGHASGVDDDLAVNMNAWGTVAEALAEQKRCPTLRPKAIALHGILYQGGTNSHSQALLSVEGNATQICRSATSSAKMDLARDRSAGGESGKWRHEFGTCQRVSCFCAARDAC